MTEAKTCEKCNRPIETRGKLTFCGPECLGTNSYECKTFVRRAQLQAQTDAIDRAHERRGEWLRFTIVEIEDYYPYLDKSPWLRSSSIVEVDTCHRDDLTEPASWVRVAFDVERNHCRSPRLRVLGTKEQIMDLIAAADGVPEQ